MPRSRSKTQPEATFGIGAHGSLTVRGHGDVVSLTMENGFVLSLTQDEGLALTRQLIEGCKRESYASPFDSANGTFVKRSPLANAILGFILRKPHRQYSALSNSSMSYQESSSTD